MNFTKKQFVWVILTIIIFEITILANLDNHVTSDKITKVSFFIGNIEHKEILGFFNKEIENTFNVKSVDIFITQINSHSVINFIVTQDDKKINQFLNGLIYNPYAGTSLAGLNSKTEINVKYTYLITVLFIFLPVLVIWLYLVRHKETKIHEIDYKKLIKYISFVTILMLLSNYIVGKSIGAKLDAHTQDLSQFIINDTIVAFIFIVILAPVVEEFLFRGLLFRFFIEKKLVLTGAVLISLEFVLAHYFYLQLDVSIQAKTTMIFGFFLLSSSLCWIYYRFNSILAPIALHSVNNLIAFILILTSQYS